MRKKRLISFFMVFVFVLGQIGVVPVHAEEIPKAPINLLKAVEKNQFLQNDEFTIDYKIQPQPIQADEILPADYLKDKEIVLVMDTSGSMGDGIVYNAQVDNNAEVNNNELNNYESIFEEKYAPGNVSVNLRNNKNGQSISHYKMNFTNPRDGQDRNTRYLVFYSEDTIDKVEKWIKKLNSDDLWELNLKGKALWRKYNKPKNFNFSTFNDVNGNSYNSDKVYNVYVTTINDPYNGKVIGLAKANNTIGNVSGEQPEEEKIKVMKEVAKNFLEKFKSDEDKKIKVALVPYSSYAENVSLKDADSKDVDFANLSDTTEYTSLTNKIDSLTANGGTNIGDGLRKAYYKFSDSSENARRYVILMTDGEPTFHSSTYTNNTNNWDNYWKDYWNNWNNGNNGNNWNNGNNGNNGTNGNIMGEGQLYYGNGNFETDYYYFGGGSYATENDKLYANKVAKDKLLNGGKSIDSFMIAFSNGADKSELKNIANSANGYFKEAVDGNALDEVYQQLAEQIQSDLPIHGINFEEIFPTGLDIVSVSDGIEFDGQKVTGDIGSISYILNKETNQFEAEPFEFTITLKGSTVGNYKLGKDGNVENTSFIDYKDIDGEDGHGNFPTVNISVYENQPPEITASLTEDESNLEKYKLSLTINEPSKIEIINVDGGSIYSADKTAESLSSYPKTFIVDIDKVDLTGMFINVKATDKSNNISEETVPLIYLNQIEVLGQNQINETITGTLNLTTEMNSIITSISINGKVVEEDRLLDEEGKYSQIVDFQQGTNEIEVSVKNQFNNNTTFKFNRKIGNTASIPNVNIKVSDATGLRDTYEALSQDSDKRADKILADGMTLVGDSLANISVEGEDVDFFKYQFLERSNAPENMPTSDSDWQDIDLNETVVNEDAVTEKQGFLNQRSYDVSDGIGVGAGVSVAAADNAYWKHSDKVFKYPLQATTYKSASYSSSKEAYGGWENYIKDDGTEGEIWVTNSVFLNNMRIGSDYREASKFWGYIKVDETGDYKFGAHSDDGCRGYITVNGETDLFVDMFGLQGRNGTVRTTGNEYPLEKDKYYPIYLEYFNWGGSAAFEIKYSKNDGRSWGKVPQNCFYPSKNITPGEYATSIFSGSKGVKFPAESGDYYIAYQTGKDSDISREGVYGPFTVNGKSTINVSKAVNAGNPVIVNEEFMIDYTITPGDIIPRSTFKENGEFKDTIFLSNIKLQDEYPDNFEIKIESGQTNMVKDGQKITAQIDNIEYNLVTENKEEVYRAEPLTIQITLTAKEIGDYTLSELGKSILIFTDVNEANRQIEFGQVEFEIIDNREIGFELQVPVEEGYLVGDTANIEVEVTANNNDGIETTTISEIKYSMSTDDNEFLDSIKGETWNLDNMVITEDGISNSNQENTLSFKINSKPEDEEIIIKNTLTYNYLNNTPIISEKKFGIESGEIKVSVIKTDGTVLENIAVVVTGPGIDGGSESYIPDDNGDITLKDQPSGEYTLSITGLDEGKYEVEEQSKIIELSYGDAQQEVEFEIIDKREIGLELEVPVEDGYLVGDTANIKLTVTANNDDGIEDATISEIKYSMSTEDNEFLDSIEGETWNLDNMVITEDGISNSKQKNTLSFKINSKPEDEDKEIVIKNTLTCNYLNNTPIISEKKFGIESGEINVSIMNLDGTPLYVDGKVKIVKIANLEGEELTELEELTEVEGSNDGNIDDSGIYSQGDIPSGTYRVSIENAEGNEAPAGTYKVSVEDADGNEVPAETINPGEVKLSYGKSVMNMKFEVQDRVTIINSGMYINDNFVTNENVVIGFDAYLATEFKVFGDNPDIRSFLDEKITEVDLKLYKIDDLGNLTIVSGIVVNKVAGSADEGTEVIGDPFSAEEGKVNVKIVFEATDDVVVDANGNGKRKLKINVPGTTSGYNSYLIQYTISQKSEIGDNMLKYNIKVNDTVGNKEDWSLNVVPMPVLY